MGEEGYYSPWFYMFLLVVAIGFVALLFGSAVFGV